MTNEEYVRSKWDRGLDVDSSALGVFVYLGDGGQNFKSWAAAAEFTHAREKEIEHLKDEIEWINNVVQPLGTMRIRGRVFRRLESALSNLKKGMK